MELNKIHAQFNPGSLELCASMDTTVWRATRQEMANGWQSQNSLLVRMDCLLYEDRSQTTFLRKWEAFEPVGKIWGPSIRGTKLDMHCEKARRR